MRWRFGLALVCGLVGLVPPGGAAPRSAAGPETRYEIPYRLTETNHIMVRVKINGKGPFNLIMDTGAPAVFITKGVAKKANVEVGNDGWASFKTFELEGGMPVAKAKARVEDLFQLEGMNGLGLAGVELHGVIGYNVLAQYRIEYDFTSDKLAFEPLDFEPPELVRLGAKDKAGGTGLEMIGPMMKAMASLLGIKPNFEVVPRGFIGIEFEEKDGIVVKKVLTGSPAEKAGIKPGDQIEEVRNLAIDDVRDLRRALAKAGVGTKLKVVVKRGEKIENLTIELGRGL
jgi:hypothetical protein